MSKRIYLDLDSDMVNKLKVEALKRGRTMKSVVEELVKRYLAGIKSAATRKGAGNE